MQSESFYQFQKIFLFTLFIELTINRLFFRIGSQFIPLETYGMIVYIGDIARYMMVFLNFIMILLFYYFSKAGKLLKIFLLIECFLLLIMYILPFFEVVFPAWGQLITLLMGGFIINVLILRQTMTNENYAPARGLALQKRMPSIFSTSILITILIIFDFALFYEISFTYNSISNISLEISNILFITAQILTAAVIGPLIFLFPLIFRKHFHLRRTWKIILITVIIAPFVVMVGFVNSGLLIRTEEHIISSIDIFIWTGVFVAGFTDLGVNMIMLNIAIISWALALLGIFLIWNLGRETKNQNLKQYGYGLFTLFSGAFLFVEATDIYFFMLPFIGFLLLNFREGSTPPSSPTASDLTDSEQKKMERTN